MDIIGYVHMVVAKIVSTNKHGDIKEKTESGGGLLQSDAIISVDYRINSKTATQYGIWYIHF